MFDVTYNNPSRFLGWSSGAKRFKGAVELGQWIIEQEGPVLITSVTELRSGKIIPEGYKDAVIDNDDGGIEGAL